MSGNAIHVFLAAGRIRIRSRRRVRGGKGGRERGRGRGIVGTILLTVPLPPVTRAGYIPLICSEGCVKMVAAPRVSLSAPEHSGTLSGTMGRHCALERREMDEENSSTRVTMSTHVDRASLCFNYSSSCTSITTSSTILVAPGTRSQVSNGSALDVV